jgi:hypothetical protein
MLPIQAIKKLKQRQKHKVKLSIQVVIIVHASEWDNLPDLHELRCKSKRAL